MIEALTIIVSALAGGGAVYLWMRGEVTRFRELSRLHCSWAEDWKGLADSLLVDLQRLQAELTRLTDRDTETGQFVRKEKP